MAKINDSFGTTPREENTNQPVNTIDSFENIYNHHVGKIYRKCLLMTNDDEDAKDFTQDIFLKVFTKLNTFQNRAAFSTWLYTVAHNYCLDQLRINKRFSKETLSDELISQLTDFDYLEAGVTKWHTLEPFINNLPAQEVMILRLKHEHGLSVKEISEHYQLSESAIKMRLKRTRDKLQGLCSNYYS